MQIQSIQLSRIVALPQVRSTIDPRTLQELAASITEQGLLQPVILRPEGTTAYAIVAGHRRVAACSMIGMENIPAILVETDNARTLELQLAENLHRDNLSLSDTAQAVRMLADMHGGPKGVLKVVNKSKAWVSKHLALTAPRFTPTVRELLDGGIIEDLEVLLALDQIAKTDDAGTAWARAYGRAKQGFMTRDEARSILANLKERAAVDETDEGDGKGDGDEPGFDKSPKRLTCTVTLSSELMEQFVTLGGEAWLKKLLRRELKAAAKP